jgi:SEC-C motif-containing protein
MSNREPSIETVLCPCGSKIEYHKCCGRFLIGEDSPQTAEQLMRSRYSGFVFCDEAYLLATWHADTRPSRISFNDKQRWLGLSIRATEAGGPDDTTGVVEYVARYKVDGKGYRLHEASHFEKIDGRWYCLDGKHL